MGKTLPRFLPTKTRRNRETIPQVVAVHLPQPAFICNGEMSVDIDHVSPARFSELSGLSLATVHRRLADGSIPKKQYGGKRCRILIPLSALSSQPVGQQASNIESSVNPNTTRPVRSGTAPRWMKTISKTKE